MQKNRSRVHAILENTGSAIQKFVVAPIVEFLRLHHEVRH